MPTTYPPGRYAARLTDHGLGESNRGTPFCFMQALILFRIAADGTVSAGPESNFVIAPDDLGRFVLIHRDFRFVCFNAAFDYWAVEQHLRTRDEAEALAAWWAVATDRRLHDPMILDQLLRLAESDAFPAPRDLSAVARDTTGVEVDKTDPYRFRYAEIIGRDWDGLEPGFFEYAVKDAIVTLPAYLALRDRATALADGFGAYSPDVLPGARERFGLLTESMQVQKAIALAVVTRNGMRLDPGMLRQLETDLRVRLDAGVRRVRASCPDLYKTDDRGRLVLAEKTQVPAKRNDVLIARLAEVAAGLKTKCSTEVAIPLTVKTGKLTTSGRVWSEYRNHDPFLRDWLDVEDAAKSLSFFTNLNGYTVHPRYTVLVRTGRTSCSAPNIQQIPRDGGFRLVFVASPGHLLLSVDYSFIELRTLAAHCFLRYGRSALADVIKAGVDPHAHTAALMLGVPIDEFLSWKTDQTRKAEFTAARQAAKAINFGVPGGLGAESLREYARTTYGVDMTPDEARSRREFLINTVYPELAEYLAEDGVAIVARNLNAPIDAVRAELGDTPLESVRKILAGDPKKADGKSYQKPFVSRVWSSLTGLNRNPDLAESLGKRTSSAALADLVCLAGVATITGRIRGRVRYSQARNTPFQGLAADGAALALFEMVREGFRVVGFVHDEVLVELPDRGGYVHEAEVNRVVEIMCGSMRSVLVGDIPVACEYTLGWRWDKSAKPIVRDGRVYPGD